MEGPVCLLPNPAFANGIDNEQYVPTGVVKYQV